MSDKIKIRINVEDFRKSMERANDAVREFISAISKINNNDGRQSIVEKFKRPGDRR